MNLEAEKINALAEAYIEALTEAFIKMAETIKKVIRIFERSVPELKKAIDELYGDEQVRILIMKTHKGEP